MTDNSGADAASASAVPATAEATRARFAERWPDQTSFRFFWRTDARHRCEQITPTLADAVGPGNADLVGHDLVALAPVLSPNGALAAALARRATWSGIDVEWPVENTAAAVVVSLGAVAMLDGEGEFDGLRGFGIVRLDRVVGRAAGTRLIAAASDLDEAGASAPLLSRDEQDRFRALAAVLREQVGDDEVLIKAPPITERAVEIGRNALALFDKLPVGLLASRNGIPIFANRFFLEFTGFADEDALHAAGGLDGLLERMPAGSDLQAIGLRTRTGGVRPVAGRIQRVDWDHLPATLLTVRSPDDQPAPALAAERELRNLRHIQEITTDGCVFLDDECRILSVNRSAEALFGRDGGDLVRQPFLDLFTGADRAIVSDYLAGLKTSAAKALLNDGRDVAVTAGQGTIPVFLSFGRLEAEAETGTACFCALFHDRSALGKLKRAHDDAVANGRRAADALATLVERLGSVAEQAVALADGPDAVLDTATGCSGEHQADRGSRRGQARDLAQALGNILNDAKGALPQQPLSLDLNGVVRDAVAAMQPLANQNRIIVRSSLAPALPAVRLDKVKAGDLLQTLLTQAIARCGPGDQVIVATAKGDGTVTLRLRDTGPLPSESASAPSPRLPDDGSAPPPLADGSSPVGRPGGPSLPDVETAAQAAGAMLSMKSGPERGSIVEVSLVVVEVPRSGNG